jgi:hypothetical protein
VRRKTVANWRKRAPAADRPTGPRAARSSTFSPEQEAIVLAFRRHSLPPLDDCLYALQATLPRLTRSALHRCLQRHGISRLAEVEGDKPTGKAAFKPSPFGSFLIDIAQLQTGSDPHARPAPC